MNLEEQFKKAETDVASLSAGPGNNTQLLLYSFHKQVMKGDAPEEGPTNIFDIVGKAKHEAWARQRGKGRDECMQEYITLVEQLKSK